MKMPIYLGRLAMWAVQGAFALYWNGAAIGSARAFSLAQDLWTAFGAYWLIASFWRREIKQTEPWVERLSHLIPLTVAFALIFRTQMNFGALGARFIPPSIFSVVGLVLTAAGIAFAIWARVYLGMNWSASVTIRSGHELIGGGPYRFVRHPIYTGMIVGLAGTVLMVGEVRALVGFAVAIVSFYLKAKKEDAWLTREFGTQFNAYASHTGMFFPKIAAHS